MSNYEHKYRTKAQTDKSLKKAVCTQGYGGHSRKFYKQQANKRVRRFTAYLPNGSFYRKLYNSWDICDYVFDRRYTEYPDNYKPRLVIVIGKCNYFVK